jgi:hypothetical protein
MLKAIRCVDGLFEYDQGKVWNETHRTFLENIAPEVIDAANAIHPTRRYVNTKYVCEEAMTDKQRYSLLSAMEPRSMKASISMCCRVVLKWKPRTSSHNNRGGRIYERTDIPD